MHLIEISLYKNFFETSNPASNFDIDAQGIQGETPLQLASRKQLEKIVGTLLMRNVFFIIFFIYSKVSYH